MTLLVEQTPSGKYILRYNASLLKESNCLRKVWFILFRGLVPSDGDRDFKMDYGTAFHKALRHYYAGGSLDQCIKQAFDYYSKSTIPESDWRSTSHLINCIMQYAAHWKRAGDLLVPDMAPNGEPMLEISFQYPFYSTPTTDVLLSGTIDFKGTYANAFKVIVDHKATSLLQKEIYLNSYVQSPQLMTYKMIYEMLFPGEQVQCLINGIFLKSSNKNDFMRSQLIDFTAHQITQHRDHLYDTVRVVVDKFEEWLHTKTDKEVNRLFRENYTCCDQKYGMCQYLPICMASTSEDQEGIIETSYAKRIYDPSKFQS